MTAIPEPEHTLARAIDAEHEKRQEPPRPHLGCSLLGHPCDRWLWYSFRWAVAEQFTGRILRLFRRGHMEEDTVISDLRLAGVDVIEPPRGQQFRVDFGWHVSGSVDGVVHCGVPEAPNKKHILEIKTHSKKSFSDLQKKGVKDSKPTHWAQMQLYMKGMEIDRALYYSVCKDDDAIYTERVRYDEGAANKLVERGHRIVQSDRIPEPVSADPSWYQCKFCPAHDNCHNAKPIKDANCRTCAHSTPNHGGTWTCERWDAEIPSVDAQRQGCPDHVIHPHMVPWEMRERDNLSVVYIIDGQEVVNGHGAEFTSAELLANTKACLDKDPGLMMLRDEFDGEIIG